MDEVTEAMIEAGQASYANTNGGEGVHNADLAAIYLAMKALDPDFRREEVEWLTKLLRYARGCLRAKGVTVPDIDETLAAMPVHERDGEVG